MQKNSWFTLLMVIFLYGLTIFKAPKPMQNDIDGFSNCILVTRPTNVDGKFEYDRSIDGVFHQKWCNLISSHRRWAILQTQIAKHYSAKKSTTYKVRNFYGIFVKGCGNKIRGSNASLFQRERFVGFGIKLVTSFI